MTRRSLAVMLLWGLMGCATLTGPQVTVRDMRFFEHGGRVGPSRSYGTQFDASKARYIEVELKLEYPPPGQTTELSMACLYSNPEGQTIEELRWTLMIEPTSNAKYTGRALGWPKPGKWTPGLYKVECRAKGQRIAKGAFNVVGQWEGRLVPPRDPLPPPKREPPSPAPAPKEPRKPVPVPDPSPQATREPPSPAPAPKEPRKPIPVPDPSPQATPEPPSPPSQPRLALVIGNAAYPDSPLLNPVNDATKIRDLLEQLGFTVTLQVNADQRTMERAIETFTSRVPQGSVGLFYFSGHGVQIEGANYLIPIGGVLRQPSDLRYRAVSADWVLNRMADAGMDMKVLILDACRDNPFGRSGTRTLRQGLAVMDAPKGSLIAYATSPGQTALDGTSAHSPYTAQLLQQIPERGRPIELMFKAVRERVQRETNAQQTPWEASSLTGDFYFAGR